jgi:hypothetical protein
MGTRLPDSISTILSLVFADRVFLCCDDLATNGQEQLGILLPLVQAAKAWSLDEPIEAVDRVDR